MPYLVFSTASSTKEAKRLSQLILKAKLAACVNLIEGVDSFFWWKGKIDRAREVVLIIKTDKKHLKSLETLIRKHHSYDTPEIIGLPIEWGSKAYLSWIRSSLERPRKRS